MLGLAAPARAEETPPDSAPAPEPAETHNDVEWRFAWDGAPTYEVWVLTPEVQQNAKLGLVKDFGIVGRVGASLFLDWGFVSGDEIGNSWNVELRRLRIETLGKISYGLDTSYKISFGAEEQKIYLNDFWLAWRPSSWFERIRLGYIDPPFSLEALNASQERSFMEAAAPVTAFAPGYRLGLEARNRFIDPDVSWIGSLSSVGQSQQFSDASDSPFRASLRAIWRPGGTPKDSDAELWHVGASIGYSFSGSGDVHYRARPESSLAPYLVDTGNLRGDAAQLGLELARRAGPLTVQGEWIGSWLASKESGTHLFSGSYIEAAWAVTGERRPYDPRSGLFQPMTPLAPFSWEKGMFGGLELAGRVSFTDLTDGSIRGGRMLTWNASAIWSLSRYARIHFDCIYADVKDRPSHDNDFIAQMRLELTL
ncbi:MAG TPA: porin [Myxococcota bacterium]|nr:porin [Myxococcota bacterium]